MSLVINGVDGFLFFISAVCFLLGGILAGTGRGGKGTVVLLYAGLLFAVLTGLLH